jgi:hypothetical protein
MSKSRNVTIEYRWWIIFSTLATGGAQPVEEEPVITYSAMKINNTR